MAGWAVRYRAGEHRWVWDELRSAGALAPDDPRRADAEAVVEQTVTIIEDNLRLIERQLLALGYRFLDPAPGASVTGMTGALGDSAAEALADHGDVGLLHERQRERNQHAECGDGGFDASDGTQGVDPRRRHLRRQP